MESRIVLAVLALAIGSALATDQLTSSTNSFNIQQHQQQQPQYQPTYQHQQQQQYQAQATSPQVHVVQPAIGLQYSNLVQQSNSYQTQSVAQPIQDSASSSTSTVVQGQGKSHYDGSSAAASAGGKDQQSSGSAAASTAQHAAGSWGFNQEIVLSVVSLLFLIPVLLFFFNFVLVKGPAPGHGGGFGGGQGGGYGGGYGGGQGGGGGRPGITIYTKLPSHGGGGKYRSTPSSAFATAASLMNQLDMDALTKVAIKAIETMF